MNDHDKAEVDAIVRKALEPLQVDVTRLALRIDNVELLEAGVEAARGNPTRTEDDSPSRTFEEDAWQKLLATTGGAAALAGVLATHLRESITPSGPQHEWTGTSPEKVIEVLEACGARLQEFRPDGIPPPDLTPLGKTPFAKRPDPKRYQPCCSFCGKSQKKVARLLAGPMVHICNGCVEMCSRLIFCHARGFE
jgi:hypothetical protein